MFDFIQVVLENVFNVNDPSVSFWASFIITGLIFKMAFEVTGFVFDKLGVYDSDAMSDFNGFIRCILILVVLFIFALIGEAIKWLKGNFIVFTVLCAFLVIFVILYRVFSHLYRKKHNTKSFDSELSNANLTNTSTETAPLPGPVEKPQIKYDRSLCPRCGAKLRKMHGPYGSFWGCEAYFTPIRCKYTRKYF